MVVRKNKEMKEIEEGKEVKETARQRARRSENTALNKVVRDNALRFAVNQHICQD